MGLASKLQAAGPPGYPGGPPTSLQPGGGSQQAQGGSAPGQSQNQYQAYSGAPSGPPPGQGGYPPQGQQQHGGYPSQGQQQQGGYPPQGGQHYGGAPPSQSAGPQQVAQYKQLLMSAIQEKGLQNFYPPGDPRVDQIAQQASTKVDLLCQQWRVPREVGSDIVKLALYDVVLYLDDSGSMAFEQGGSRIDDLKVILGRVAFATSLFDEDGIQVRFMNSTLQGNGIRNEQQANQLVSQIKFSGMTPLGRELNNKILGPLVLQPARAQQLRKPILVITITDGAPSGESQFDVAKIIKAASDELASRTRYGKGAISFQFAQVGDDKKAQEFLGKLDEDPSIGDIIDCTSDYEVEEQEMKNANPPVELTPELWLIKLLLGSIDASYDSKDEKQAGGARPPAPPGGGYGGPGGPGQYGGPPQQGGYPGQQQYGQQQGGYPPQQQQYGQQGGYPPPPQQGNYNRPPPQQGGYPLQQGGYGAPPPPPRY